MNNYHSMKDYLSCIKDAADDDLDYIITTKHKYLLVLNSESYSSVLLNVEENYIDVSYRGNYVILIIDYGMEKRGVLAVDLNNEKSDIIGFSTYETAITHCCKDTLMLCSSPDSRVIRSPQIANYLLDKGFRIVHLKPKRENPNETVFVFENEEGFEEAIKEYREEMNYV